MRRTDTGKVDGALRAQRQDEPKHPEFAPGEVRLVEEEITIPPASPSGVRQFAVVQLTLSEHPHGSWYLSATTDKGIDLVAEMQALDSGSLKVVAQFSNPLSVPVTLTGYAVDHEE